MKDYYASIVGIALTLCCGAFLLWILLAPIHAQQAPYTLYPIDGIVETIFGPMEAHECLVVTAQGFAVMLLHSCPK